MFLDAMAGISAVVLYLDISNIVWNSNSNFGTGSAVLSASVEPTASSPSTTFSN